MGQYILIDSRNNLMRHQHVHGALSRSADGFPTGAIFGCLSSMLSMHKRLPDAAIVWIWDGRGETWRHKFMATVPQLDAKEFPEPEDTDSDDPLGDLSKQYMASFETTFSPFKMKKEKKRGYKAQRHRPEDEKKKGKQPLWPETPRERALLQIPVLKLILEGCGIRSYEVEKLECDDLIAMIAKKIMKLDSEAEIYIDSGDKDYYQLLVHKQIRILAKKDGTTKKLRASDIEKEYGVRVKDWAKYRALTGDSSDNVPHLAKVGSVRAKEMLASGIDPSKSSCPVVDEKWLKYFPHGMTAMWPALNGNYKLCRLVDDPKDELLSDEVRKRLAPMFDHFDNVKRFYRSSKGKTPESFRKVSFVLAQYELASIIARRDQLWEIP